MLFGPFGYVANAQDPAEAPDRYEVEIIVFRHLDQSRNTPEQPPVAAIVAASLEDFGRGAGPNTDTNAPGKSVRERNRGPLVTFFLQDPYSRPPDYRPLDDGRKMGRIYSRLERLDAYAPLVHRGWLQTARPADAATRVPIRFESFGEYSVSGTVRLYKERYVHLEVDLELVPARAAAEPSPREDWPAFGDALPAPEQAPEQAESPVYELRESRRIRGANAQYFDHPQFGVIALISKVDLEEEADVD